MSEQFTTTFVPKKPITPTLTSGGTQVSRPAGLLTSISTLLFFITLLIAGGVYFWQQFQAGNLVKLQESVATIEKTFEPQLITQLQTLDKQLNNANTVLKNHTVVSPVFSLLETSTLPQVRFTRFDMVNEEGKDAVVKMSGEADGYTFIAQQSDVLSKNTFIKDMIFSNFVLTQRGKISFDVSFSVRSEFTDFERAPLTTSVNQASSL
jgi:hypothetical protein